MAFEVFETRNNAEALEAQEEGKFAEVEAKGESSPDNTDPRRGLDAANDNVDQTLDRMIATDEEAAAAKLAGERATKSPEQADKNKSTAERAEKLIVASTQEELAALFQKTAANKENTDAGFDAERGNVFYANTLQPANDNNVPASDFTRAAETEGSATANANKVA